MSRNIENQENTSTSPQDLLEIVESNKIPQVSETSIIKSDNLVQAILEGSGTFELIDIIVAELAKDSAHLDQERVRQSNEKKTIDRVVKYRSSVLKMIVETLVQKRNLALSEIINLRSPQWLSVMDSFIKKIKQTFMDLNFADEQIDLFFEKLKVNMEGFEEETEQKIKNTYNVG